MPMRPATPTPRNLPNHVAWRAPQAAATTHGRPPSSGAFGAWSLLTLAFTGFLPTLLVLPSLIAARDLLDYYSGAFGFTWLVVVFLTPVLASLAILGVLVAGRLRRTWPTVTGLALGASLAALVLWAWTLTFVGEVWPT